jgi:hypothetical protein
MLKYVVLLFLVIAAIRSSTSVWFSLKTIVPQMSQWICKVHFIMFWSNLIRFTRTRGNAKKKKKKKKKDDVYFIKRVCGAKSFLKKKKIDALPMAWLLLCRMPWISNVSCTGFFRRESSVNGHLREARSPLTLK